MNKKKGLGRGLSALFGDQKINKTADNNTIQENQSKAAIGELIRNKFQPRIKFDNEKIKELSDSIKKTRHQAGARWRARHVEGSMKGCAVRSLC